MFYLSRRALTSPPKAYFLTQMKLAANVRALRVSDARNPLGLAHSARALLATLALLAEARLF